MAEMGLMGIEVEEEWDGAALDPVSYVIAMEEISTACASTGVIMSVNNSLVCDPLRKFATDAQKEKYLKPLARGDKLGCFMLSEPNAGSDAAAQKTTAKRDGDGWVINGVKNWITNGPQADYGVLICMNDPEARHKGICAFVVDMNAEGVERGPKDDKLGIRASHSCQVFFTDHRVSDDQMLGKPGDGFKVAMATLDAGRIGHPRRRRWASAGRPSRPPPSTRRSARPSASPSASTRRSSSCSPTWTPSSRPRGCSLIGRRG